MEWFGLAASGHVVARWSSDILPSSSIEGATDDITKLPDLLQRPAGATPAAVVAIGEHLAEVQAPPHDHIECGRQLVALMKLRKPPTN